MPDPAAERFAAPGRAPLAVRIAAALPYGVKRWIWEHPLPWRVTAGLCRRSGWGAASLGAYAASNGPYRGLNVRAIHANHLWIPMGGYEPDVSVWADAALRNPAWLPPGHDIYDIGAYMGLLTLLFARHAEHVYAFEPSPANRAEWHANLALNPELARKTTMVPSAVSDRTGELEMTFDGVQSTNQIKLDGVAAWSNSADLPTVKVPTLPLDALLDSPPAGRPVKPGFLKIDIEGAEGFALAGAKETLRRFRPALLVETHNDGACAATCDRLREADYVLWRFQGGGLQPLDRPWPGGYGHVAALPRERSA